MTPVLAESVLSDEAESLHRDSCFLDQPELLKKLQLQVSQHRAGRALMLPKRPDDGAAGAEPELSSVLLKYTDTRAALTGEIKASCCFDHFSHQGRSNIGLMSDYKNIVWPGT